MVYRELDEGAFVIEYGAQGDEFFLILEGECEVLVPNKKDATYNEVNYHLRCFKDSVDNNYNEVKMFHSYKSQLMA